MKYYYIKAVYPQSSPKDHFLSYFEMAERMVSINTKEGLEPINFVHEIRAKLFCEYLNKFYRDECVGHDLEHYYVYGCRPKKNAEIIWNEVNF